jgi:hypothetical protein
MRLRLVNLPMIGWALLSFVAFGLAFVSLALVSLMTIELIPPAHAGELDQAYLRGSTADAIAIAPAQPNPAAVKVSLLIALRP